MVAELTSAAKHFPLIMPRVDRWLNDVLFDGEDKKERNRRREKVLVLLKEKIDGLGSGLSEEEIILNDSVVDGSTGLIISRATACLSPEGLVEVTCLSSEVCRQGGQLPLEANVKLTVDPDLTKVLVIEQQVGYFGQATGLSQQSWSLATNYANQNRAFALVNKALSGDFSGDFH